MRGNDDPLVIPGLADCRSGLVKVVNGMIQKI
jgi:hypothetical protein